MIEPLVIMVGVEGAGLVSSAGGARVFLLGFT